jgi:phosphomethylpyrimidine synthase
MNATDKQLKNNIDEFVNNDATLDPLSFVSFSNSKKVYIVGSSPDIRVPFREISLSDTPSQFGAEKNPPVMVYDTSGAYTDPTISIDIREGLPALRTKWIEDRADTEILSGPTSILAMKDRSALSLRKCALI